MLVITVARKPLDGTVARTVLAWGTGGLNIDACRISTSGEEIHAPQSDPALRKGVVGQDLGISRASAEKMHQAQRESILRTQTLGRWPANLILCPEAATGLDEHSGINTTTSHYSYKRSGGTFIGGIASRPEADSWRTETGGASRFFKQVGGSRES